MRVERTSNTSRELSLDVGIVNEASGSAKYRMGQTVATAVVLGPSVPKFQRHEDYRAMTVEVTYSMSLGGGSGAGDSAIAVGNELKRIERECAHFVKSGILGAIDVTRNPRTLLVIKVTIDFDDGNALCAGFNACVMALLSAGIRMNYVPIAIGLACIQVDSTLAATVYIPTSSISSSPYATESAQKDVVNIICVDPLKDEEDVATSKFCFVLRVSPVPLDTGADTTKSSPEAVVVHSRCRGIFSDQNLQEAMDLATLDAAKLLAFVQSVEF